MLFESKQQENQPVKRNKRSCFYTQFLFATLTKIITSKTWFLKNTLFFCVFLFSITLSTIATRYSQTLALQKKKEKKMPILCIFCTCNKVTINFVPHKRVLVRHLNPQPSYESKTRKKWQHQIMVGEMQKLSADFPVRMESQLRMAFKISKAIRLKHPFKGSRSTGISLHKVGILNVIRVFQISSLAVNTQHQLIG